MLTPFDIRCFNAMTTLIAAGENPTVRRLKEELGTASQSCVHHSLIKLQLAGCIRRLKGYRGWVMLKRPGGVPCPHCEAVRKVEEKWRRLNFDGICDELKEALQ